MRPPRTEREGEGEGVCEKREREERREIGREERERHPWSVLGHIMA
jgi:hypothetical protein